jgi:hypothetical protein
VQLPKTREQVVANIQTWNEAVRNASRYKPNVRETLLQTVSRTQAWIVIYRGGWLAAPLKFAGSGVNMTPETYERNRIGMNPNAASARLGEIFWAGGEPWEGSQLDPKHPAAAALNSLAATVGRKLREGTALYALRGECLNDPERQEVERLVALIRDANLGDRALEALTARLAA